MTITLQEKLNEILRKDISHHTYASRDENYLSIKYNEDTNNFKAYVYQNKQYKMYEDLTFEDVLGIIENSGFTSEYEVLCTRRLNKEKLFAEALRRIIEETYYLDIDDELKNKMYQVISRVSLLPERVGTNNRVFLQGVEPGTSIHLRLTDSTCVTDQDGPLHLQVIMEEECKHGFCCHVYPQYNLEQISSLIEEYEPKFDAMRAYMKRM